MVRAKTEDDFIWFFAGEEVGVIGIFNGSERIQINQNFVIKLVCLHVFIEFWDFEELVDMETIFNKTPLFLDNINQPGLDQNNPEKEQENESYQQEKKRFIKNSHGFSGEPRGGGGFKREFFFFYERKTCFSGKRKEEKTRI